jgi:hypothetical protein
MTAIIIVAIILIIIGIASYFDTESVEERKREEFVKNVEKTNESFSKSKSFKDKKLQEEMLVKEETPVESKGIATLTEHIESVVIKHPESVKKLTEADKKALDRVGTRRKKLTPPN